MTETDIELRDIVYCVNHDGQMRDGHWIGGSMPVEIPMQGSKPLDGPGVLGLKDLKQYGLQQETAEVNDGTKHSIA